MKKSLAALLFALSLLLLLGSAGAQAETSTTILMYMCGTDLQSDCVNDLYEMCAVDMPSNVHVVVQAGGASQWDDSELQANMLNRFEIVYNAFSNVHTAGSASMGDPSTLFDFLDWGVSSYPADRYVLVLWDHGGGSDSGICFDETADFDSLTIHEIYNTLYDYTEKNPDFHLDILGCDACLMATYEMAAHFSWYADFLVASEELEPWLGWYYTDWMQALADNPEMDTQSIAVAIADAFMKACMENDPNDYVSQSVIYLPAVQQLVEYMETYSAYLVQALEQG
ncbi:MAG: clostripain-related cysteine peptidase [Eubacteriales bacterium]|nr:clostripain-related cysteine peptidase [Eubacteriales bacterium]